MSYEVTLNTGNGGSWTIPVTTNLTKFSKLYKELWGNDPSVYMIPVPDYKDSILIDLVQWIYNNCYGTIADHNGNPFSKFIFAQCGHISSVERILDHLVQGDTLNVLVSADDIEKDTPAPLRGIVMCQAYGDGASDHPETVLLKANDVSDADAINAINHAITTSAIMYNLLNPYIKYPRIKVNWPMTSVVEYTKYNPLCPDPAFMPNPIVGKPINYEPYGIMLIRPLTSSDFIDPDTLDKLGDEYGIVVHPVTPSVLYGIDAEQVNFVARAISANTGITDPALLQRMATITLRNPAYRSCMHGMFIWCADYNLTAYVAYDTVKNMPIKLHPIFMADVEEKYNLYKIILETLFMELLNVRDCAPYVICDMPHGDEYIPLMFEEGFQLAICGGYMSLDDDQTKYLHNLIA